MQGCMKIARTLAASILLVSLSSCATGYTTPGRPANLTTFSDPKIKKAYVARPAIRFPANIAVVRVQDGSYTRGNNGGYSVISTRDLEKEGDLAKIQQLPGIEGIAPMNQLLLPQSVNSQEDLREAAAKLQADAILIYTVNTQFKNDDVLPPLTIVSLSLLSINRYEISSTASGILMDTRTGYVYGAIEGKSDKNGASFIFDGSDMARQRAERTAFEEMLRSFEPVWKRTYARYNK